MDCGQKESIFNKILKEQIVLEVLREDRTVTEVSAKYGVHPKMHASVLEAGVPGACA